MHEHKKNIYTVFSMIDSVHNDYEKSINVKAISDDGQV